MGDTTNQNHVPTLEELGIDPTTLPEVPERYVAVLDDGFGELTLIAARGVEIITIPADAYDPWDDIDTTAGLERVEKGARQAIALVAAGDHFEGLDRGEFQQTFAYVITELIPELRDDLARYGDDYEDDLT